MTRSPNFTAAIRQPPKHHGMYCASSQARFMVPEQLAWRPASQTYECNGPINAHWWTTAPLAHLCRASDSVRRSTRCSTLGCHDNQKPRTLPQEYPTLAKPHCSRGPCKRNTWPVPNNHAAADIPMVGCSCPSSKPGTSRPCRPKRCLTCMTQVAALSNAIRHLQVAQQQTVKNGPA